MPRRVGIYATALVALAWLLAVYCLWAPAYLPLIDLPNHMARHWLEACSLRGSPLPPFYAINYRILPNLGGDLVLPVLLLVFEPQTAARIFLTLSVFLFWLGPAVFLTTCCERKSAALAASLFLLPCSFNNNLFMGFLNYYSGLGLAFLVLAHYVRLSRQERLSRVELFLHTLLVVLLFFWHLSLWVMYSLIAGSHLLTEVWTHYQQERRLGPAFLRIVRVGLPILPSLVLLVVYVVQAVAADSGEGTINWGGWERKAKLPFQFFLAYDKGFDVTVVVLWLVALGVCFGLASFRSWSRNWLLLAVGFLVVAYLLLPFQFSLMAHMDERLLPALLVCGLGVVAGLPFRHFRVAVVLLAICLLLRTTSVVRNWERLSDRLAEESRAFDDLEPNSRILPVILLPEWSLQYPEGHFPCWVVPSRGCLVRTLFSIANQQPSSLRPPYDTFPKGYMDVYPGDVFTLEDAQVYGYYDYVWLYNPEHKTMRLPARCQSIFTTHDLTLYRVLPRDGD